MEKEDASNLERHLDEGFDSGEDTAVILDTVQIE